MSNNHMNNNLQYRHKYLKYKQKYLELKQHGGLDYNDISQLKINFLEYVETNLAQNINVINGFDDINKGIRICTYNIHYFTDIYEKKNTYNEILSDIQKINADIIILEEAIIGGIIKINSEITIDCTDLYNKLNDLGYKKIIVCNNVPSWYNGVYCNLMLINDRILTNVAKCTIEKANTCEKFNEYIYSFPKAKSSVVVSGAHQGTKETRCFIYANVNIKEYNIHIFGTHLDVGSEDERLFQISNIIEETKKYNNENDYIIIMGDFNTDDKNKQYMDPEKIQFIQNNRFIKDNGKVIKALLDNNYFNIFSKTPNIEMTTWNNTIVDFIFIKNGINKPIPENFNPKIYFTNASDHLPLCVDINF